MVSIRNLSFTYKDKAVLTDVNVDFKDARLTAILGKNGSGKTTLLKIMAGLLPIKKGKITVDDVDINELKDTDKARFIGYLPQIHNPTFAFKVIDVVLTGRFSYVFSMPNRRDIEKAEEALQLTGIGHLRDNLYTELSGGERQMVMMARLLAQQPQIMLLDEPMTHLDLPNQMKMWDIIQRLVERNHTVIAVIHDPNSALRYSETIVMMKDGRVIYNLNPSSDKFIQDKLTEMYDMDIKVVNSDKGIFVMPP